MRLTWTWVMVLVAAGPVLAAQPGAADARKPVVLLETAAPNVAPALRGELGAAVRDEVERSRMFRAGPAAGVTVKDLMATLVCQSMDEGCLRKVAAHLKADVLVYLELDRADVPRARLKVLHVQQPRSREVTVLLRNPPADVAVLRTGLRDALHRGVAGRLDLTSSPAGARVLLDGVDVGVTPCTLDTVAPGPHALRVEKDGHTPQDLQAQVKLGEPQQFHLALVAAPVAPAPVAAPAQPQPAPAPQPAEAPAPATTPSAAAQVAPAARPERPLPRVLTAAGGAVAGVGGVLLLASAAVGAVVGLLFLQARLPSSPLRGRGLGTPIFWAVNGGAVAALVLLPVAVLVTLLGAAMLSGGVVWLALE